MMPPSPGQWLWCRLIVLFALGTLLGHVCALEPGHHDLADVSAGIGSADLDFGGAVTIHEASCESLKPAFTWPGMRVTDSRPLPVPGLAVSGSARAWRAANAPVPRVPLFVLHAALLI
jgi:hypothetical protein